MNGGTDEEVEELIINLHLSVTLKANRCVVSAHGRKSG